jgi:hypothetical protein
MVGRFRWTATTTTRVGPAAAFAYLADPRHADAWFARVEVRNLPPGPPRAGHGWVFYEPAARSLKPVRLAVHDEPRRFVWETRLRRPRTNMVWELALAPASGSGTTLTFTMRWRPAPLGLPLALAAVLLSRGALDRRTQQTIERARDALEAVYPARPARTAHPAPPPHASEDGTGASEAPPPRAGEGVGGRGPRRSRKRASP